MQTKLTISHDRITLIIKDGKTLAARVTWGRNGTRVSGSDVWGDEQFTRRFLTGLASKAHNQGERSLGDHAKHLQSLIEDAADKNALLAVIA